jgi:hypothetical protein
VVAAADHSLCSNGARRIVLVRVRRVAAAIGPEAARKVRSGELVGMAGVGAVLGGAVTVAGWIAGNVPAVAGVLGVVFCLTAAAGCCRTLWLRCPSIAASFSRLFHWHSWLSSRSPGQPLESAVVGKAVRQRLRAL